MSASSSGSILDYRSFVGRLVRLPLRLVPRSAVLPVLSGPLRGARWVAGSATAASWLGTYESEACGVFVRHIAAGDVVYDLGANAGYYSLIASRRVAERGHVYAFEPLPGNLKFLKAHVERNRCTNVEVLEMAVTEGPAGEVCFEPGDLPTTGKISESGSVHVRSTSLDEFVFTPGARPPTLLKIDVEGAEVDVLTGAARTLNEIKPRILLATHSDLLYERCSAILKQYGYRVEPVSPSRPTEGLIAVPESQGVVPEPGQPQRETEPVAVPGHEEHRERRERFLFRTIRADLVTRGVVFLVRFLSIPLALRILGEDRYGIWLAVTAALGWLNLTQLGIGGGLVNELGKAYGRGDEKAMRRSVSTAFGALLAVALVVAVLALALARPAIVGPLLGVGQQSELLGDAMTVFRYTGLIVAATIAGNTVISVCAGLQETFLYSNFFSLGTFASLVAIVLLSLTHGSLGEFTLAMGLPSIAAIGALAVYMFGWRHPHLRPSFALMDKASLRLLMAFGAPLLLTQLADLAIFSSAGPLLSSNLGPTSVTLYQVPWSLFMFVVNACDGIVRSCLGGYVEALARNDWFWIKKTIRRTRLVALGLITGSSLVFLVIGPWVIRTWTRGRVTPSIELLAAMAVYCILMVASNTNTVLVLGMGKPRIKALTQSLVAAIHVVGFFLMVPSLGLLALPVAGSIGYLIDILISYSFTARFVRQHAVATPTIASAPPLELA